MQTKTAKTEHVLRTQTDGLTAHFLGTAPQTPQKQQQKQKGKTFLMRVEVVERLWLTIESIGNRAERRVGEATNIRVSHRILKLLQASLHALSEVRRTEHKQVRKRASILYPGPPPGSFRPESFGSRLPSAPQNRGASAALTRSSQAETVRWSFRECRWRPGVTVFLPSSVSSSRERLLQGIPAFPVLCP